MHAISGHQEPVKNHHNARQYTRKNASQNHSRKDLQFSAANISLEIISIGGAMVPLPFEKNQSNRSDWH
jgi:hypothetical protein